MEQKSPRFWVNSHCGQGVSFHWNFGSNTLPTIARSRRRNRVLLLFSHEQSALCCSKRYEVRQSPLNKHSEPRLNASISDSQIEHECRAQKLLSNCILKEGTRVVLHKFDSAVKGLAQCTIKSDQIVYQFSTRQQKGAPLVNSRQVRCNRHESHGLLFPVRESRRRKTIKDDPNTSRATDVDITQSAVPSQKGTCSTEQHCPHLPASSARRNILTFPWILDSCPFLFAMWVIPTHL